MEGIFLLIFYLVLFIFEIILFVFALKKGKAFWKVLFLVEVISFIIPNILLYIYEHLPPDDSIFPGLSYLAESLYSLGAIILYSLILFISICTKIIIYEKKQKLLGKKYVNPIISIIAFIFLFIGFFDLIFDWEGIYILAFAIGLLILVIRFKDKIK